MSFERIEKKVDALLEAVQSLSVGQAEFGRDMLNIEKDQVRQDREIAELHASHKAATEAAAEQQRVVDGNQKDLKTLAKVGWTSFGAAAFIIGEWLWSNIIS